MELFHTQPKHQDIQVTISHGHILRVQQSQLQDLHKTTIASEHHVS